MQLTRWQRESAASATRSRPRFFSEHRDAAHSKQCAALGPDNECAAGMTEARACGRNQRARAREVFGGGGGFTDLALSFERVW